MKWRNELYASYVSSEQAGKNFAEGGQLFPHNRSYVEQLIRRHFPVPKQSRILDLGCGHGTYLYFAKRQGYTDIQGIDFSDEQVRLAHELGIPEVKRADIDQYLESTEEKFDLVMMMDVIEHLEPQQLFDSLRQVRRILNPDGKLILHVPNAEGLFGMRVRYGDYTHVQAFTPSSISQVLRTLGFHNIQCFEEKPVSNTWIGRLRYLVWQLGTIGTRLLMMSETGGRRFVLSANMLVTASNKG